MQNYKKFVILYAVLCVIDNKVPRQKRKDRRIMLVHIDLSSMLFVSAAVYQSMYLCTNEKFKINVFHIEKCYYKANQ